MVMELNCTNKVAGAKQVKRALNDGRTQKVFLAEDADPRVTEPLAELAKQHNVEVELVAEMKQIGQACSLAVGCAAAAIIHS